jgi:hypothetical protein
MASRPLASTDNGTLCSLLAMPAACRPRRHWIWPLAVVALLVLGLAPLPAPARAATTPPPRAYVCDGDPLLAELVRGPMDDPAIPDPSAAPVPVGGWVVLRWRELSLQLPRTNNAGEASFSDGKWWWSLEDPAHPRYRLRQPLGAAREFACDATS